MHALTEAITHAIREYGVWGVFFLMLLESACIPAPSEVIMLFAGYLVWKHDASFVGMVAAGVAGNIVGSWVAWAAGAYGGRGYIERHGPKIHVTPRRLEMADRWFERWGSRAIFFSRMLPIIRTFISLPAGIARMPFGRFTALTALGCIPWVAMLCWIGVLLGPHWHRATSWYHLVAAVTALVIALAAITLWRRSRRENR